MREQKIYIHQLPSTAGYLQDSDVVPFDREVSPGKVKSFKGRADQLTIASARVRGGHHSVQTVADRNAIPADFREQGMTCWVIDEDKNYRLTGGIANINWFPDGSATFRTEIITKDSAVGSGSETYYLDLNTSYVTLNLQTGDNIVQLHIGPEVDDLRLESVSLRIEANGDSTDPDYDSLSFVQIVNMSDLPEWVGDAPQANSVLGLIGIEKGKIAILSFTRYRETPSDNFSKWGGVYAFQN